MKDFENTAKEIKELCKRLDMMRNDEEYLRIRTMTSDELMNCDFEYIKKILGNYMHDLEIVIYMSEDVLNKMEETDSRYFGIDLDNMVSLMDRVTNDYISTKKLYETL